METEAKYLREILEKDNYIIPRYQRNYAWGKKEISQLIKDIYEYFKDGDKERYYLGTLVCFKRESNERTCYELIDGQQRHTTITLINLVLKNWDGFENKAVPSSNLKFDSRRKSQYYLESLYKTEKCNFSNQLESLSIAGTGNFKDAIEIIREDLRKIEDLEKFVDNFFNRVCLFRVEVPEETDLNHYFEIMNNRGEQLEKHEIVKANLMERIEHEDEETKKQNQEKFAVIWDACSDMTDYVYFNFDKTTREYIFDKNGYLKKIDDFSQIKVISNEVKTDNKNSLSEIIAEHKITQDFPKEEKISKDKYRSIIDFPNFLLQVLCLKNNKVSLDDKKLVDQFETIKPDPIDFIIDLLKYRTLFDMYVIKQDLSNVEESKQNWGIRKLDIKQENDPEFSLIKTFDENEEALIKLQVLFYYSDSTNTYNKWLQDILGKIFFGKNLNDYTEEVYSAAKQNFKRNEIVYPNITVFNLYFIDFLLWKIYKEENVSEDLKPLKDKIDKTEIKSLFNNFKFRQISSREHLLSQEHSKRDKIDPKIYNGIGNLCLISTSQNSKGNKENPSDKKKLFHNDNTSLKRIIMFESFENDKWEPKQIEKHKTEIMQLIDYYIK